MENKIWDTYIALLEKEIVPAIGCTEPIAVAYASAKAMEFLTKQVREIEVCVSGNMLKNGMGVGVPGTGMIGLDIAAAVGALGGIASAKLEVLKGISKENVIDGKRMLDEGRVKVKVIEHVADLYIEVTCMNEKESARVIIQDTHTNIILIEVNGKSIFQKSKDNLEEHNKQANSIKDMTLTVDKIYDFAINAPYEKLKFVRNKERLNEKIAKEGLTSKYGLQVGRTIDKYIQKGLLSDDLLTSAVKYAAAASDARMAGCMLPTMSNSGSGNQGISASLPVIEVAQKLASSEEELTRALVLSNLISIHMHEYLSRLAGLCGTVVASTGAACGITYLLGGNLKHIKKTINNMAGNVTGLVCDGAKTGCALKVATTVTAAIYSAILAIEEMGITDKEGIVENDVEKTIMNIGNIGSKGMTQTDKMMLKIMKEKNFL